MAYCRVVELKEYLDITGSGDDGLLEDLIAAAQESIDIYCGRTFEASADTTRTFTVGEDTDGQMLYFDADICAITTVTTDADGAATVVPSSDYVTYPRNETPYYALKLKSSSTHSWDYTDDPADGVTVAGKWAYSTTAPADVAQACKRLAAYMYRQKDAQVFDVTAIPEAGVMTVPQGIPADVARLLRPYIRR